jgi:nitrous oxide reductase accessory protein NosL
MKKIGNRIQKRYRYDPNTSFLESMAELVVWLEAKKATQGLFTPAQRFCSQRQTHLCVKLLRRMPGPRAFLILRGHPERPILILIRAPRRQRAILLRIPEQPLRRALFARTKILKN